MVVLVTPTPSTSYVRLALLVNGFAMIAWAPTRKAPARKASAKKPAAKKIQVNVGAKKRPQRKKK